MFCFRSVFFYFLFTFFLIIYLIFPSFIFDIINIQIMMTSKQSKTLKNSDSDYKAEDEGSASDNSSWRKYKKASYNFKLTKKQMIQNSIKTLVPIGTNLKYQSKITNQQYEQLTNIVDVQEFSLNFKCMLGRILEVIDGEIFRAIVFSSNKPVKVYLRLNGVSTPDIKRTESKDFANYVKKVLKLMLEGKIIRVQTGQYDKSGHLFSRIYAFTPSPLTSYIIPNKNCLQFCVNDYLIQHDMAKSYHSKNRSEFSKKNYGQFCDKYETKVWPVVQNYPLQLVKVPAGVDYDQKDEQDDE